MLTNLARPLLIPAPCRLTAAAHVAPALPLGTALWQGRATLVLGPPGAGKSLFMKAITGRIKSRGANFEVPHPLSAVMTRLPSSPG